MPVLDDPDILRTWKQLLCILFCMLGRNTIATQQAIQVVRRAWDLISGQFDTSYLNLGIKKHDLEKSRVFYEISCASSGALPEKLQKQVFDFFVTLELAQVWCKALPVKAQLFRRRGCSLRFFFPRFPPCGVDCLLI